MNIPATLALSAALACATVQASAQDLRSSRRSMSPTTAGSSRATRRAVNT